MPAPQANNRLALLLTALLATMLTALALMQSYVPRLAHQMDVGDITGLTTAGVLLGGALLLQRRRRITNFFLLALPLWTYSFTAEQLATDPFHWQEAVTTALIVTACTALAAGGLALIRRPWLAVTSMFFVLVAAGFRDIDTEDAETFFAWWSVQGKLPDFAAAAPYALGVAVLAVAGGLLLHRRFPPLPEPARSGPGWNKPADEKKRKGKKAAEKTKAENVPIAPRHKVTLVAIAAGSTALSGIAAVVAALTVASHGYVSVAGTTMTWIGVVTVLAVSAARAGVILSVPPAKDEQAVFPVDFVCAGWLTIALFLPIAVGAWGLLVLAGIGVIAWAGFAYLQALGGPGTTKKRKK